MTARNLKVTSYVHLALLPHRDSIVGATLDEQAAHRHVQSINGVAASVPVSGDYRLQGEPT
jgi:hypothetical protein